MLHFASVAALERELNDQFAAAHPNLSVSLSEIRWIKSRLISTCIGAARLELSSLAKAFVYFEKMILAGEVASRNAALIACVCVLIAAKFDGDFGNKDHHPEYLSRVVVPALARSFAKTLRKSQKTSFETEIWRCEWAVLVALRFDLHLKQSEFMPHVERILADEVVDFWGGIREWLGEEAFCTWQAAIGNFQESDIRHDNAIEPEQLYS